MNFSKYDVVAYADGACKGNPGPGGWGVRVESTGDIREYFGGESNTTNNQMELTAGIEALKQCILFKTPLIVTDSKYVYNGITEWVKVWENNGWRTANKSPVKNAELWRTLNSLTKVCNAKWYWVKGHAACPGNNRADVLANRGIKKAEGC